MVGALLSLFVAIGYVQLAWTGGDGEPCESLPGGPQKSANAGGF